MLPCNVSVVLPADWFSYLDVSKHLSELPHYIVPVGTRHLIATRRPVNNSKSCLRSRCAICLTSLVPQSTARMQTKMDVDLKTLRK